MTRSLLSLLLTCSPSALAAELPDSPPAPTEPALGEVAPQAPPAVEVTAEQAVEACAERFTVDDVEAILEFAGDTWAVLDVDGFRAANARLEDAVPCLQAPVSGRQAAEILRWRAMDAFIERREDASKQWFASARLVDPYYRFPATVVPANNPLITVYEESASLSGAFTELRPPASGTLQINGRLSLQRPDDWPAIVQLVSADDQLIYSGLLRPGEPMPAYDYAAEGANLDVKYDSMPVPLHRTLYVSAGATGAVSVVLWMAGLSAKGKFNANSPSPSYDELSGLRARANTLTGTSLFLAATSGALVVVGNKSRSW